MKTTNNMKYILLLFLPFFVLANNAPSLKAKEKIPGLIEIGAGVGEYEIYNAYDKNLIGVDPSAKVYGTQLEIWAIIEQETIRKYQNKIPENYRKAATSLGYAGVSSIWIPRTLYISPLRDNREAYGVTWGFTPKISTGIGPLELGVSGGPILTYMHFRDFGYEKPIQFIRPGLRGQIYAKIPLFTKYLKLEVGETGDIYAPQGLISFYIPLEVEAEI
jgi:hypothetical protein